MCGILVYLYKLAANGESFGTVSDGEIYDCFMKFQSRGPERSHFTKLSEYGVFIGFHRLSIMDTRIIGDQPFTCETEDKLYYLVCNGEIYNYKELCKKYEIETHTGSDCEILLPLWMKIGMDAMVKQLNGEYAFIICEITKSTKEVKLHISRDHCGVRPLFVTGNENELVIMSELKGSPFLFREEGKYRVQQFKPRNYASVSNFSDDLFSLDYKEYINFADIETTIYDLEEAKTKINKTLREAVKTKMMTNRPLGSLLSGGLDSALVSAIAAEYCRENGQKLRTFSIGMPGGTDEKYAKMVAKYINSDHTHIEFSNEEFLGAIHDVILCIESIDITSIRASTGMYLITKWIRQNTDIKVLFSSDISDELVSGYLYNFYAPNPTELHHEALRIMNDIHYFDVLRSDRSITRSGIEARVPFSHNDFVKLYFSINPEFRMPTYGGIEKWLLRESFAKDNLLPKEVLWRIKCAFSDGVSSEEKSWFEIIQDYVNTLISDHDFDKAIKKYNHLKPVSKESLYYRRIFEKYFGTNIETSQLIPYFWLPKWTTEATNEPSARVLKMYKEKMKIMV
jgi:asparagine synthase (glutamine-hydrolysing)